MDEREQQRRIKHRLAVLRHVEEVSGNVAATCRYYGISRPTFYKWLRQLEEYGEFAPVSRQPFNALNNDELRRARRTCWRGALAIDSSQHGASGAPNAGSACVANVAPSVLGPAGRRSAPVLIGARVRSGPPK